MKLILHLLCLLPVMAAAQPATDIYLLGIDPGAEGYMVWVKSIRNLTDRPGYDNQPAFTADSKHILFSSQRGDQTDIYKARLKKGRAKNVTCTPESEYSPMPHHSGEGFTVVRVESDSAQHLRYYEDDCDEGKRLIPTIDSIGYYTFLSPERVALFILGQPHYLLITDMAGNDLLTYNSIGRSLHKIPGTDRVSFVWKRSETDWWLCSIEETGMVRKLDTFTAPFEDYCWLPDGRIAYAKGSEVVIGMPGELSESFSFDLKSAGISNITRVTVSPDGKWMCIVANDEDQGAGVLK